jgi:hypothetical protein
MQLKVHGQFFLCQLLQKPNYLRKKLSLNYWSLQKGGSEAMLPPFFFLYLSKEQKFSRVPT